MEQVPYKKSFCVYFLVIALDSISFGLVAPILAPLLSHPTLFFNGSHSPFAYHCLYGLLITLFPLMFMFGAPALGLLSDRFGRKKVLLFSLIIMLAAFTGYALAFTLKNIWILMIARMLAGLSAGSQGVAQAAVADLAKSTEKPQAMSIMAIGMTLGLAIGPLIASFWSHTAEWVPFLVVILLGICAILLLVFYSDNRSPPSAPRAKKSWKSILQNKNIMSLLAIFLFFEMGWSLFYQALPLRLSMHWHMQTHEIGLSSSYIGIALAIFLYIATRIGLRFFTLNTLMQIGFIFGTFALIIETTDLPFAHFLLFTLPIVFAVSVVYPGLISQLSESVSSHEQGLIMGISDTLLAFSFAITGILSSFLVYFNSTLPFLIAATFWIIASIWCFKYKKVMLCNSVSM